MLKLNQVYRISGNDYRVRHTHIDNIYEESKCGLTSWRVWALIREDCKEFELYSTRDTWCSFYDNLTDLQTRYENTKDKGYLVSDKDDNFDMFTIYPKHKTCGYILHRVQSCYVHAGSAKEHNVTTNKYAWAFRPPNKKLRKPGEACNGDTKSGWHPTLKALYEYTNSVLDCEAPTHLEDNCPQDTGNITMATKKSNDHTVTPENILSALHGLLTRGPIKVEDPCDLEDPTNATLQHLQNETGLCDGRNGWYFLNDKGMRHCIASGIITAADASGYDVEAVNVQLVISTD